MNHFSSTARRWVSGQVYSVGATNVHRLSIREGLKSNVEPWTGPVRGGGP